MHRLFKVTYTFLLSNIHNSLGDTCKTFVNVVTNKTNIHSVRFSSHSQQKHKFEQQLGKQKYKKSNIFAMYAFCEASSESEVFYFEKKEEETKEENQIVIGLSIQAIYFCSTKHEIY